MSDKETSPLPKELWLVEVMEKFGDRETISQFLSDELPKQIAYWLKVPRGHVLDDWDDDLGGLWDGESLTCLLFTSPSPRD